MNKLHTRPFIDRSIIPHRLQYQRAIDEQEVKNYPQSSSNRPTKYLEVTQSCNHAQPCLLASHNLADWLQTSIEFLFSFNYSSNLNHPPTNQIDLQRLIHSNHINFALKYPIVPSTDSTPPSLRQTLHRRNSNLTHQQNHNSLSHSHKSRLT